MNVATDRLRANEPDIASKIIDGEAILINLQNGAYYSLRESGALVWHLLRGHHTRGEIAQRVAAHYGVPAADVEPGISDLLGTLVIEDLVRVSPQPAATALDEPAPAPHGGYAPPHLEKFTDMEELLALDPPTPGALDGLMRQSLVERGD